jgi:hypothetical protein
MNLFMIANPKIYFSLCFIYLFVVQSSISNVIHAFITKTSSMCKNYPITSNHVRASSHPETLTQTDFLENKNNADKHNEAL